MAPAGVLVNTTVGTFPPLQTVIAGGTVTVGNAFTVTVEAAVQVVPPLVTVTVYVPLIAIVEPGRVGFCNVEEKAAGPLQLYVPPPVEFS